MRKMKAFIATIYFPILSLKQPLAFQVADTNLLPSPSSLRGALAKSLAYFYQNFFNGSDFQSLIEKWLRKIENVVPYVTAKPETMIIKGTVILSRLRTLEQRGRTEPRDAMRRGITFLQKIKACYIVDEKQAKKELGEDALEKIKHSLWNMDRVGDTESLISVSEVLGPLSLKLLGTEGDVNTVTNYDLAGTLDGPLIDNMDFIMTYEATGKNKDVKKPKYSRTHFLPFSAEKIGKFIVYKPKEYRVRTKRDVIRKTKTYIYQIEDIKLVAGDIS